MGIASKFNKSVKRFNYVNTEGFGYFKLSEIYEEFGDAVLPIKSLFISNKGRYGDTPVIISSDRFVNLPSHLVSTVKAIIADDEAVTAINEGKFGFTVYQYHNDAYNRDCYSINFVVM